MLGFDSFDLLLQIEAASSLILVAQDVLMHDPILKILISHLCKDGIF